MAKEVQAKVAGWRIASQRLCEAARATSNPDARRKLAQRAFRLAQEAESLERRQPEAADAPVNG